MPKQKENQTLSAWERRNLYAKQLLASRNKTKMDNTNSKPNTVALKSVENATLQQSTAPQQDTKVLSKKRIASTSASFLQATKRTKVELAPRVMAKATPKSKRMIKPRNTVEPLKMDVALVRFTAKPVPITKKVTVKRPTPTQRQSIVKRNTPRVSLAPSSINRRPNKYQVPSKIDTGLRKKITTKVKITREGPTAIIQDLDNPIPGTSSGLFAVETCPTPAAIIVAKPITPASKPKVTKKRKISFGGKTNPRRSARSGNTPILSAKRAKMIAISESKHRESMKKIRFLGLGVDTHVRKVKAINQSAQSKPNEDAEEILPETVDETFDIDFETLPELGEFPLTDEVFEPCTTSVNVISTPADAAPIKKRSKSKSVSFKVPADTERIRTVLPRTPRTRPSLRTGLSEFAAEAGINTAKIRHLHCLGAELSDLKKKSRTATVTPQSTPTLRVKPRKAEETSPVQPTEGDLNSALNELKDSILKGMRPGLAENWLEEMQDFYPHYQVMSKFTFWECKALVEEKKGDFEAALEIYNEASNKVSEEESELLQEALGNFLSRAPLNVEETNKENSPKKTPKPRKSGLDPSKIFDSKIVKFVSAKNANSSKKVFQSMTTPNQIQSVFTPVRRSARLSARNPGKSGVDLEEISQDELARTLFVPNSFLD